MLLSSVLRGMRWIIEIAVFGVVAYFILLTAQDRIARSQQIGNWVTGECDAGSEADGLNSGMNYYKQGFLANAGLPDRGHPASGLYLNPDETPRFKSVYTHYPPGPNWIIGLSIYAFGPSQVPIYRMVPIVFSVICLFATYFMFRACWGAVIAGAAVVTLVHIPMKLRLI